MDPLPPPNLDIYYGCSIANIVFLAPSILIFILPMTLVLVLGVDAFYRKESGYPYRDFASHSDMAYKLEI